MRSRDTLDVATSISAMLVDALFIFGGFMLAVWLRFDSGWVPLKHELLPPRSLYLKAGGVITLLFLFIFAQLDLYVRPQTGRFGDKIPRLVRAVGWGIFLAIALAFIIRTEPPFSRVTAVIAFFTISLLVLVERYLLFRYEIHLARHRMPIKKVLIVGTDALAARLKKAIEKEPRLRCRVTAYLRTTFATPDPAINQDLILGTVDELEKVVEAEHVGEVLLSDTTISHIRMAQIILFCERNLVPFRMVPDLFGVLTNRVHVEHIGDIPLIGMAKWPLDHFWNRLLKRGEDIVGALLGLVVSAPILAAATVMIKRESPGPAFFKQTRCGEGGREFTIYKLRTMRLDAEENTGPVWAAENDPRRTQVGAFLRKWNLDELPQFWNVLCGEMSLVGPRPERPHFVEQFKEDIGRYMFRHVSKPGMTGWAQVNGLRGNTSIQERIQYDLYYLENWSLAFDFKILAQTFIARENAY